MKLTWITDLHLDFLNEEERQGFYEQVNEANGDVILLSGDIADAPSLTGRLEELAHEINRPIYFVLGNHDFYHGKVSIVRDEVKKFAQNDPVLNWLPASGPKKLDKRTYVVGVDSWADARYGDYANSHVSLNDSRFIQELAEGSLGGRKSLQLAMQKLADEDASLLKKHLHQVTQKDSVKQIVILVHVPPFKESCLYQDLPSTNEYLPFFSSKATGDVILEVAKENQEIQFQVLCGHTHCKAYCEPAENLTVKTGGTDYMRREIEEIEL